VVACSTDGAKGHRCWINTEKEDGGFGGDLNIPLWSDPSGALAAQFDLFDEEEFQCLNGIVVIDDGGVVRHAMTTSLECDDTASNCLELVKLLKVYKSEEDNQVEQKTQSTNVRLSASFDKDWDVSRDPGLMKALEVAKRLGQSQPPHMIWRPKNPTFDLAPTRIRRMVNPRASVQCCSASVYRNLAGFGSGGEISVNQKLQIENIMKKVLGVAFMPEELTGEYISLSGLSPKQLGECFEKEIFSLTGDSWARDTSLCWQKGTGVFVNNYENFLVWINKDDQLKLVSTAQGQDLKYVLLRLQKAVIKIEEAIKSCQDKGFTSDCNGFSHSQIGVNGTGLEVRFNLALPGFRQAGRAELDKSKSDLNLTIVPSGQEVFTVELKHKVDQSEYDIVTKSVEMVDKLWRQDQELQSRFGVKLTL